MNVVDVRIVSRVDERQSRLGFSRASSHKRWKPQWKFLTVREMEHNEVELNQSKEKAMKL